MSSNQLVNLRVARRQFGYSIVEMAIVLAVIGLLLGVSLVPLGAKFRAERNSEVKAQLVEIEQALLGYALRHRTQPAVVVMEDPTPGAATLILRSLIPGDRPYLPCPDVTGDGFEDRFPLPDSSVSISAPPLLTLAMVTLAVAEALPVTVTMTNNADTNQLLSSTSGETGFGNCVRDKGVVPWATLGTPPNDPWGSRFTYRVDPMFANSLIGFGSETRSDTLDPRVALTTTVSSGTTLTIYQRRRLDEYISGDVILTLNNSDESYSTVIDDRPGLVCTRLVATFGCSMESSATIEAAGGQLLNSIVSSAVTMFNVTPQVTVARLYQNQDIVSGMAFVVVSHGANTSGAIPHQESANNILNTELVCSRFEGTVSTWSVESPEAENADSVDFCRINSGRNLPDDNLIGLNQPHNSSFVEMPENDVTFFDDQLRYMSDSTLLRVLSARGANLDQPFIPPGPF